MKTTIQTIEPAVVTPNQAAQYLNCHPKTVRQLCREGTIRAIKLGSEWRIPTEALDDFLNGATKVDGGKR